MQYRGFSSVFGVKERKERERGERERERERERNGEKERERNRKQVLREAHQNGWTGEQTAGITNF